MSLVIATLAFTVAAAVQTPSQTQVEEMRKLEFLVGEWKGDGWQLNEAGERSNTFSQKTKVQAKTNNATLRIEDRKSYKPWKGMTSSSTLDADISYNETTKLYNWRGKGSKSILEAKLTSDRTFHFGMPFSVNVEPREGYRKTTIRVTLSGSWEETLEVWSRGKWYKAEQSILTRVK